MKGLTSAGKEQISNIVEEMFNNIAVHLVGNLPKYRNRKTLSFSHSNNNLAGLFIQSMSNRDPSTMERDLLKGLLESASGYIDALKSKTKSNVSDRLDSLVREYGMKNKDVPSEEIDRILEEEMRRAKSHLIKISEAESTKIRNTGMAVNIVKVASEVGEKDPTVYFAVVRDGNACKWCIKNHLMPDGVTPRVFKMSEVRQGYLSSDDRKNGEVSLSGSHPHCRCSVVYLSKGFGFKNGIVSYESQDHDEYSNQRD